MSTRKLIYKLEKELSFWQQVHKHEPMDEREFELERQLRQLSNPNELGIPRNDGQIEDDDDEEYEYISVPRIICCRYCNKPNLKWMQIDGKWRLSDSDGLHICKEYKMNHTGG